MYCEYCGNKNPDGAKFCGKCGRATKSISESDALKLPQESQTVTATPSELPSPHVESTQNHPKTMRVTEIKYGSGAAFWLGLCTILNFMVGVWLLVQKQNLPGFLSLGAGAAYLVLWLHHIEGYAIAVVLACLSVLLNVSDGLGAYSVLSLINPAITFLVIRKYYFADKSEGKKENDRVSGWAVLSGVISAGLMFAKWVSIDLFIVSGKYSLYQMATSKIHRVLKWLTDSSMQDVLYVMMILFVVAAAISLILEICACVAFFSDAEGAKRINQVAGQVVANVSWIFIALYLVLALFWYLDMEYSVTNWIELTPAPVLAWILGSVQFSLSGDKKKKVQQSAANQSTLACPGCGARVGISESVCPYCGFHIKLHIESKPTPTSNTVTCPFCKQIYPKGTVYCNKCGGQIGPKH